MLKLAIKKQTSKPVHKFLQKFFQIFFLFLLGGILNVPLLPTAHAAVWTEENQWTPEWEAKFSQWVQAKWNKNFFANRVNDDGSPNPYYGVRVDCADAVYSMRIVFSYENRLPFAINDPTSSKNLITNQMTRFDSKPNANQKFRAFLSYMHIMGSTRTLPEDTYPIRISRETFRPGSVIVTVAKNHHSWTVQDILATGIPHLVYNSVIVSQSTSTMQDRTSWPNPEWVFEGNFSPQSRAGIRYWKPIQYVSLPYWEVPGYSDEQWSIPIKHWNDTVQRRLKSVDESPAQTYTRVAKNICDGLLNRVEVVRDAVKFNANNNYQCLSYELYDEYSTPSRDHRVFDDMIEFRNIAVKMKNKSWEGLTTNQIKSIQKVFPFLDASEKSESISMAPTPVNEFSICSFDYGRGTKIDMAEAKRRFFRGWISNNPNEDLARRWGESGTPSPQAAQCPSWDIWTPVLKD